MTLRLTPALLRATYEYLVQTPPFSRWGMPAGEDVRFRVTRSRDSRGYASGALEIGISSHNIGRTDSLLAVMAHEMVHVRVHATGHRRAEHGREFLRCARLVCRHHGFDCKLF